IAANAAPPMSSSRWSSVTSPHAHAGRSRHRRSPSPDASPRLIAVVMISLPSGLVYRSAGRGPDTFSDRRARIPELLEEREVVPARRTSTGGIRYDRSMDIPSFLRMYPPFDEEGEDGLADVVRHTHIAFYPSGTLILQQSGEPARHLYVVRTGAVELIDDGQVADVLYEGEVFGFVSLFTGLGPAFEIRAAEDSIC